MAEFILKDRYGKDKTFDKDTIYVKGTDGELMQFTHGVSDPVTKPLEITENGTYTAPNGVDGYNPVVVAVPAPEVKLQDKEITENGSYSADAGFDGLGNVTVNIPDPTKTVLLEEQEFGGFVLDSTFGSYSPGYVTPALFTLNNGETYHVKWDGTEYECVAFTFNISGMEMVFIGDGSSLGLPGNGEPFLITYNVSYHNTQMFCLETTDSHTVGIWQKVTQEIKLQDITVDENGKYSADSGYDGLGEVTVAVPAPEVKLQDKTITENGEYTADSGFDGLGKVTVEVAGSGGLEPGAYYVPYEINPPGNNNFLYFKLNGNMYAIYNNQPQQNTASFDIYKYNSGTWTKIFGNYTFSTIKELPRTFSKIWEFNGKAHFLGSDNKTHYIFDEQNGVVQHKKITDSGDYYLCVCDGKLRATTTYSQYTDYIWNESTDTWSAVSDKIGTHNLCLHGGYLYYVKNNIVYKRKDGVTTEVCKLSGWSSSYSNIKVENGHIYGIAYSSSSGYILLYDGNLSNGETKMISTVRYTFGAFIYSPGYDEPFLYSGGSTQNYYPYCVNFKILIVRE